MKKPSKKLLTSFELKLFCPWDQKLLDLMPNIVGLEEVYKCSVCGWEFLAEYDHKMEI